MEGAEAPLSNVLAAQEVAQELGPGYQVVTVDSGLKYLGQEPFF